MVKNKNTASKVCTLFEHACGFTYTRVGSVHIMPLLYLYHNNDTINFSVLLKASIIVFENNLWLLK